MDSPPSQCFVNIASFTNCTKPHEDGIRNTVFMVFAGDRGSVLSLFLLGGNIFSRIFIFKVLLPKVGRVFSSNILKLFFRHTVHIGMLVRTAVGWTGN